MKISAIHRVTEDGEKNVALVLEYPKPVLAGGLRAETFSVSSRRIVRVYANDRPEQSGSDGPGTRARDGDPGLGPRDGRYVIAEMDPSDEAATTVPFLWVVNERRRIPYEVRQLEEVAYVEGTSCPPWTENIEVQDGADLEYDRFTPGVYRDPVNDVRLSYALFVPQDYRPDEQYPFVLYWHGGGEKGDNNLKSVLCTLNAVIWATEEEQAKHPCFVLAPQCPTEGDWIDPDTYEMTDVFDAVCRLMFSLFDAYSVDLGRVYCTGFSMGGMAAWETAKRYRGLVAGTLVYAGQSNYEDLEMLKDSNLWVFHGEDDDKAMAGNVDNMETLENAGAVIGRAVWDGSRRGPAAVRAAQEQLSGGAHVLHTLYREGSIPGGRPHEHGWQPAVTNEAVRDWLFAQVNPDPSFAVQTYLMPAQYVPVRVHLGFDGTEVKQIAAGSRHNLALLQDGRVFAWGFNVNGQLGNGRSGPFSDQETPVRVEGLRDVVQVATGNNFSLALAADGTLYGWGSNNCGQLGDPDTATRRTAPVRVEGIGGVAAVHAGDSYALVLKRDGTVWAWGTNMNGQLGNGTYQSSRWPVQVVDPSDPAGYLSGVVGLEAGVRTVVALKRDGTIRCWGDGEYGQIGKGVASHGPGTTVPFDPLDPSDPTGHVTDVRRMAEGRCFAAVLKNDGTVHTWGLHRHGELGLGDYRPEVDLSDPNVTPDFFAAVVHPRRIEGLGGVEDIAAGMNHTVVLRDDGSVWTWGYNKLMGSGVLGAGSMEGSMAPIRVHGLVNIKEIYAGFNHNFAIAEDGTIWAWGNARNGRLGPVDAS